MKSILLTGLGSIVLGFFLMVLLGVLCKLFSGQATATHMLETACDQGHEFNFLVKPFHSTEFLARIKEG